MSDDSFDDFFSADDAKPEPAGAGQDDVPRVPPRLGLLAPLSTEEFDQVARAAKLGHVEPGTMIFEQGDEADRFFILVDGTLEVVRDGRTIGTLEPGSFFGESALLVGGKRSASVRAPGAASLWSVDYETFSAVVSTHLLADEDARREVFSRLERTPRRSFEA